MTIIKAIYFVEYNRFAAIIQENVSSEIYLGLNAPRTQGTVTTTHCHIH